MARDKKLELEVAKSEIASLKGLLKEAVELLCYTDKMHVQLIQRICTKLGIRPTEQPPHKPDGRYLYSSKGDSLDENRTPKPAGEPTKEQEK